MRHRGLAVNDPRTGEQASYLGYLVNAGIVAYRFGAAANPASDFYLLAHDPAGRLRSVYLPDEDLLLDLTRRPSQPPAGRPSRLSWLERCSLTPTGTEHAVQYLHDDREQS